MTARPYRILQLTSTAAIGGAERVALDLARGCDPARFAMSLASLDGPPHLQAVCLDHEPAVPFRLWHAGRPWPWRLDRIFSELAELQRAGGIDLLHTYGLQADLVGRCFKRRLGNIPLLCSIHSTDAWRTGLKIQLDRRTAAAADAFVSVSAAGTRIRIEREGLNPARIVRIPNGIALDRPDLADRETVRHRLGVTDEDGPVIVHLANLRPMKGHGEVLTAAAAVLTHWPRALFLLAGRDEAQGEYQRRAQAMGLGDRVRFLGFYPEGREVIRAADLFILPSHYEGCPIAILEAMAEGRPIIASRVGGIPELVRDGEEALLIPPAEASALAQAIVHLWGDRARCESMTAAARRRVAAEFSRERMIERYSQLYESLVEGRFPPNTESPRDADGPAPQIGLR